MFHYRCLALFLTLLYKMKHLSVIAWTMIMKFYDDDDYYYYLQLYVQKIIHYQYCVSCVVLESVKIF